MQIDASLSVLRAFARARWLQARLRTPAALAAHQARGLEAWQRHLQAAFPHLDAAELHMDKAQLMANFEAFNQGRIGAETVRAVVDAESQGRVEGLIDAGGPGQEQRSQPKPKPQAVLPPGLSCGASTGTSGNRGLYLITDQERYQWLGTILAKGLPDVWRRRHRVAVILPQQSALYQAGNQSRWLRLAFYDLREGPEAWSEALESFDPTVLIAPPKVLRWLAEKADLDRLRPLRLYAGAETLDPPDRRIIEAAFSRPLGQIYMATEGLFGLTCAAGTLHLTEDFVQFDFEAAGAGLVSPRITDFSRRYQVMARYQMNDLLRLSARPCACGSPLQAVEEVVGRQDDVFWFGDSMITPDVLRNAVLDADPAIEDFCLRQRADGRVELALDAALPVPVQTAAQAAVQALLRARGLGEAEAEVGLQVLNRADLYSRKLRRVEREQA